MRGAEPRSQNTCHSRAPASNITGLLHSVPPVSTLSGAICALATPFGVADDAVDFAAFGRLVDSQIAGGTSALCVAGSTGEAAMLDEDEFVRLVEFAVERAAGRVPVLVGTGRSGTAATVAQTRRARDAGADVALVSGPPYVRPTQEGLFRHFDRVADKGGLPVVLYNIPSRTGCDIAPETVARLAAHSGIIGVKEAVADPARVAALVSLRDDRFAILSGDDPSAMQSMLAGADGVVSVASNVVPWRMAALAAACRAGDRETAGRIDSELRALYAFLGVEPNPTPVKWCLAQLGIGSDRMRLPLVALSAGYHDAGHALLRSLAPVEPARAAG